MHERDNVAIVANDGGLPAGTRFPSGLTLVDKVPQGHKVALVDIAEGEPVRRYNVAIGRAARAIPKAAGARAPAADARGPFARRPADRDGQARRCRRSRATPSRATGQRRRFGRHAHILAITTTVQCVAGVVGFACSASSRSCLPRFPNVDDVVRWNTPTAAVVAIDAPDAIVPIRTLRNISLNPNFGNEVMVVSLGCESCSPSACCRRAASRSSTSATSPTSGASAAPRSTWSACRTRRTSASCR
jgi:galactarate dehydratase